MAITCFNVIRRESPTPSNHSANHHFYPSPRGKNVFPPFFTAPGRFIKHRVSDYQSVKSFYSFYFFLSASQRFFFFLLSSICAHINIWSTIIAVSHIMDNAQLRVMKKKNNKKIASLDKKNKNFCHLGKRGRLIKNAKAWKKKT